jgi:PII-like signaling protein
MKLEGLQQRLMIDIRESDRYGDTPRATEIVQRADAAGLAGASLFRGAESYGASNHIHTNRILSLSDDLSMAIVIVDRPGAVESFLPQFDEAHRRRLRPPEGIHVVKYVGRNHDTQ